MRIPGRIPTSSSRLWLAAIFLLALPFLARAETAPPSVESDGLYMFVRLNTPDQIAAFYEARGFPAAAIQRLHRTCFVMAHIENRGKQLIWLELKDWHFLAGGKEIHRLDRDYWDGVWKDIGMAPANRSTFGWTQLPESRDLQPGETVGGNVVLPPTAEPFTLQADFLTGRDKRAGLLRVRFENLRCAKDPPPP